MTVKNKSKLGMGSLYRSHGKEVEILNDDTVTWLTIRVPLTSLSSHRLNTPPVNDASSTTIIRYLDDLTTYFTWRINKTRPNVLEIVQFGSFTESPTTGLRIVFMSDLCPFASICKNEIQSASMKPYMLYTLCVDGVAYLIKLNNLKNYVSCSAFPTSDVVELNTCSYGDGTITAVAATTGFFVIGKEDGSLSCFRLGSLDSSSLSFERELQDYSIFDNLFDNLPWAVARRIPKTLVKDLVCLEIRGTTHLLVLHSNGLLQVWDLVSCCSLYCKTLYGPLLNDSLAQGTTFVRLWPGEFNNDLSVLPLAIMYTADAEGYGESIAVHTVYFGNYRMNPPDRVIFLKDPVIDVKLSSDKIWILKKGGLVTHNLSGPSEKGTYPRIKVSVDRHYFELQESVVAEQLLQNSKHAADDIYWLACSVYPFAKEQICTLVSSIFMRVLFLPGIFHERVFLATFRDLDKRFTNKFRSLSADGMRKELVSLMERQGAYRSRHALLSNWKNFYERYLHNWSHENAPCGLLLDTRSGAVGLIRKSSISLLRFLEDIELLSLGSVDEREVLFDVFQCTSIIRRQLGYGAPGLIYESFFSEPSPGNIVERLVEVLHKRDTSIRDLHVSEPSVDENGRDHFSFSMLSSLQRLCQKGETWGNVVTVIKFYLDSLVAHKIDNSSDREMGLDITTSITVQVTSQVAKVIFESAVDILILLNYMVKLGVQINMLPVDVSRIQFELLPLLQKIITQWHIIHFVGTTPCESPPMEDSISRLSLSDGSTNQRLWNMKLGKCDFTLAFLLILDRQRSFQGQNGVNIRHLPNPTSFTAPLRNFSSWIVWGMSEGGSSSFSVRSTMLASILLKYGQFDAVEHLLTAVNRNLLEQKVP